MNDSCFDVSRMSLISILDIDRCDRDGIMIELIIDFQCIAIRPFCQSASRAVKLVIDHEAYRLFIHRMIQIDPSPAWNTVVAHRGVPDISISIHCIDTRATEFQEKGDTTMDTRLSHHARAALTGVPGEAARLEAGRPGAGLPTGTRVQAALLDGGRRRFQAGVLAQAALHRLGHVVQPHDALRRSHLLSFQSPTNEQHALQNTLRSL